MNVDIDIEFGQKVLITELQCQGIVIAIYIGIDGTKIQVRYFLNGEAKEVYFYRDELEKFKDKKGEVVFK